jgi:hypothetical protein
MKYIIKENRLFNLVENLMVDRYGAPLKMEETNEGYLYFHPSNREVRINGDEPFSRNTWGRLWVNDIIFYRKMKDLVGLKNREIRDLLKKFFEDKFGIKIRDVVEDYQSQFTLPHENYVDWESWESDED